MCDEVVFCDRGGGKGEYFTDLRAGSRESSRPGNNVGEAFPKVRSITGVPETRPEPGGTHKVNITIFVVSDVLEPWTSDSVVSTGKRERKYTLLLLVPLR